MNPQNQPPNDPYRPNQKVGNTLSVTQPGEVTICEIKRHPIGILTVYFISGALLVGLAALIFGLAPHASSSGTSSAQVNQIAAVALLILTVVCAVYALIATKVYWGNSWVVTSDSLTQVNQVSLFGRQSSQLGLGNIEDVTAEQNGILTHIFNYGVLKVETAGEHSKFHFAFCPNPNFYAKKILEARERFELGIHHDNAHYASSQQPPVDQGVNINTQH